MAEALAEPTGRAIEALFRPSTRSGDRLRDSHPLPYGFTEVELLPGLTVEDVLATGATWEDFRRFLQGKIVWMTTNVYVFPRGLYVGGALMVLQLGGYGIGTNMRVRVRSGTDAAAATATCDFLMRLLATCENHDVYISRLDSGVPPPISGAALSLFFQESRNCLRLVTLTKMALNEDQCLALTTMSRLDVEVKLLYCRLADDAAGAFVERLQSGRGPVKLEQCNIDNQIIANALTGNSRVTKLKLDCERTNDAETAILFRALAKNSGLVDLDLYGCSINDDNRSILCESLQAHPTLTKLDLCHTRPWIRIDADHADHEEKEDHDGRILLSDEQKSHRTRALADMMKANTIVRAILLADHEHDK